MRAATMSEGMTPDTIAGLIPVSLVSAALGWLGTRMIGRAALESALTATAKELLDQLRTELRVAIKERDSARTQRDDAWAVSQVHEARIEELTRTIGAMELRIADQSLPRPTLHQT